MGGSATSGEGTPWGPGSNKGPGNPLNIFGTDIRQSSAFTGAGTPWGRPEEKNIFPGDIQDIQRGLTTGEGQLWGPSGRKGIGILAPVQHTNPYLQGAFFGPVTGAGAISRQMGPVASRQTAVGGDIVQNALAMADPYMEQLIGNPSDTPEAKAARDAADAARMARERTTRQASDAQALAEQQASAQAAASSASERQRLSDEIAAQEQARMGQMSALESMQSARRAARRTGGRQLYPTFGGA